jgi:hypothetical protein
LTSTKSKTILISFSQKKIVLMFFPPLLGWIDYTKPEFDVLECFWPLFLSFRVSVHTFYRDLELGLRLGHLLSFFWVSVMIILYLLETQLRLFTWGTKSYSYPEGYLKSRLLTLPRIFFPLKMTNPEKSIFLFCRLTKLKKSWKLWKFLGPKSKFQLKRVFFYIKRVFNYLQIMLLFQFSLEIKHSLSWWWVWYFLATIKNGNLLAFLTNEVC